MMPTQLANVLYEAGLVLLQREVDGTPFRHIGIGVSGLEAADGTDPADLLEPPDRPQGRRGAGHGPRCDPASAAPPWCAASSINPGPDPVSRVPRPLTTAKARPMTDPIQKLREYGYELPAPKAPVASYVPSPAAVNLLYVSGQISSNENGVRHRAARRKP